MAYIQARKVIHLTPQSLPPLSHKTSLRNHWLTSRFTSNYAATIGVDFLTKTIPLYPDTSDSKSVTISCWDTAGQERFRSLSSSFYRGADAVIIQFDTSILSPEKQAERIKFWYQEFCKMTPIIGDEEISRFSWIVVGGKMDLLNQGHGSKEADIRKVLDQILARSGVDDDEPKDEVLDGSEPPLPPKQVLSRPDPNSLMESTNGTSNSKVGTLSRSETKASLASSKGGDETLTVTPRPRHKSLTTAKKALSNRKSIKSIEIFNPTDSDDEFQMGRRIPRSSSKLSTASSSHRPSRVNSLKDSTNSPSVSSSRKESQKSKKSHGRNQSSVSSIGSQGSGSKSNDGPPSFSSDLNPRQRFDSTVSQLSVSESIYHTPRNSMHFSSSTNGSNSSSSNGDEQSSFSFHQGQDGSPGKRKTHLNGSGVGDLDLNLENGASGSRLLKPEGSGVDDSHRNSLALSDRSTTPTLRVGNPNDNSNGEGKRGSQVYSDEELEDGLMTPQLGKESSTPRIEDMILRASTSFEGKGKDKKRANRRDDYLETYDNFQSGKEVRVASPSQESLEENERQEEDDGPLANPILSGDPIPFPTTQDDYELEEEQEEEETNDVEDRFRQTEEDWAQIPIRRGSKYGMGWKGKGKSKSTSNDKARNSRDFSDPYSTLTSIPPSEMNEDQNPTPPITPTRSNRNSFSRPNRERIESDSDPEPILKQGFSLIYTSAKTGHNVDKVFQIVVERVRNRWELEEWEERERSRTRSEILSSSSPGAERKRIGNEFILSDLNGPPIGNDEASRREALRRGIRIAAGKEQNPRSGWKSCC